MTDAKMALLELVEQEADADLVREMLRGNASKISAKTWIIGPRRNQARASSLIASISERSDPAELRRLQRRFNKALWTSIVSRQAETSTTA